MGIKKGFQLFTARGSSQAIAFPLVKSWNDAVAVGGLLEEWGII
jgi:hypothetical protein